MNLVTKSTLLLTASLITGLISIQSHAGGSGQFVMVQVPTSAAIWVLDTETGEVKLCVPNGGVFESPTCSPWSEE
jgi:hypothetical protein